MHVPGGLVMITPHSPVTFQDARGVTWWGTAVSPVLTHNQPWPVVIVQVKTKVVRVPARDVELCHGLPLVELEATG